MTVNITCISLYEGCQSVEQALDRLRMEGIARHQVSIIGVGNQQDDAAYGCFAAGDCICYYGSQSLFWGHLQRDLTTLGFFWVPGIGPLMAAGTVVPLLVSELEDMDVSGDLGILATALNQLGIPQKNIMDYEKAIKAAKILLIVHGQSNVIEMACRILHSRTQQVTVHYA